MAGDDAVRALLDMLCEAQWFSDDKGMVLTLAHFDLEPAMLAVADAFGIRLDTEDEHGD